MTGGSLTSWELVRKHSAPEGALRRQVGDDALTPDDQSESTQHHKVHEGIYRHVPGHRTPIFTLVRQNLDILSSSPSSRSRP